MGTTDGVADDEQGGEEPTEESVLPPGPRRSTYTPPVPKSVSEPGTSPLGDDALADAMAANLAAATGSINVIYQLDDVAPSVPEGVPVEQLPASPAGARILPKDESGSYPGGPVTFDANRLPSPPPSAVPADLPPPPGEQAKAVFDLESEAVQAPPPPAPEPPAPVRTVAEPTVVEPPAAEPTAAEPPSAEPSAAEAPVMESDAEAPEAFEAPIQAPPAFAPASLVEDDAAPEPIVFEDERFDAEMLDAPEPASVVEVPTEVDEPEYKAPFVRDEPTAPESGSLFAEPVFEDSQSQEPPSNEPSYDDAEMPEPSYDDPEPESQSQIYDDRSFDEQLNEPAPFGQPDLFEASAPAEEQPVFEQPVFEQPVFEQPVFEQPVFEQPIFEQSAFEQPVFEPESDEPVLEQPAFEQPVFEQPVFEQPVFDEPRSDDSPFDAPDLAESTQAFEPPSAFDPTEFAPPMAAPAPTYGPLAGEPPFDRAAALAASGAPAGKPWIPERHSLRDDEIAALLASGADHPGGTLGIMEELERQMQLRADETQEFQDWQESMLAVGTPEALAAVERVLPEFSDIVSPTTSALPIVSAPESVSDPEPASAPEEPRLEQPQPFERDFSDVVRPSLADAPPPPFIQAPPPAFVEPEFTPAEPEPELELEQEPEPEQEPESAQEPTLEPEPAPEPEAYSAPAPALPDAWDMPIGEVIAEAEPEPEATIFIAPEPLVEPSPHGGEPFVDRIFTGAVPTITGTVAIPPQLLDVDGDDPVDATDQVPMQFDELLGAHPGTAPVEPILSPRIPDDEIVLGEAQELERPRVFGLEKAGLEPTPDEQRVGRAARMFWLWFAANSSIVSLAFGAMVFSLGMSLRQAIVGILAGVAISFLPLGLGSLAGKRSGQPTMVISRAAFGVIGNAVPAVIAVASRVFWGAAMLWFLGAATSSILVGAELAGGLSPQVLTLAAMGAGLAIALVFALFGYGLIARLQLVVSIVSTILIVGFIALTYQYVDITTALTFGDGSWLLAGTAAVLVFSFVGLLWANSSSDLARYQRPGSSGAGTMLWTTFGTAVPTFLLISYGALLAASNEALASAMLENPFDSLARLLPVWYPAPLLIATALSLISGVVVTMYSGGFALKALGVSFARPVSVAVIAVLVGAVAFLFTMAGTDMTVLFRDLATTLAVPVAAWAGIFAADTMIRNRRYHADSLLAAGGIYPTVNWVNLVGLLVTIAVGFGLTTANESWLSWQGYVFTLAGVPLDSALAATDLGVFAALLLGLLIPIVSGVPAIRRQEAANAPN